MALTFTVTPVVNNPNYPDNTTYIVENDATITYQFYLSDSSSTTIYDASILYEDISTPTPPTAYTNTGVSIPTSYTLSTTVPTTPSFTYTYTPPLADFGTYAVSLNFELSYASTSGGTSTTFLSTSNPVTVYIHFPNLVLSVSSSLTALNGFSETISYQFTLKNNLDTTVELTNVGLQYYDSNTTTTNTATTTIHTSITINPNSIISIGSFTFTPSADDIAASNIDLNFYLNFTYNNFSNSIYVEGPTIPVSIITVSSSSIQIQNNSKGNFLTGNLYITNNSSQTLTFETFSDITFTLTSNGTAVSPIITDDTVQNYTTIGPGATLPVYYLNYSLTSQYLNSVLVLTFETGAYEASDSTKLTYASYTETIKSTLLTSNISSVSPSVIDSTSASDTSLTISYSVTNNSESDTLTLNTPIMSLTINGASISYSSTSPLPAGDYNYAVAAPTTTSTMPTTLSALTTYYFTIDYAVPKTSTLEAQLVNGEIAIDVSLSATGTGGNKYLTSATYDITSEPSALSLSVVVTPSTISYVGQPLTCVFTLANNTFSSFGSIFVPYTINTTNNDPDNNDYLANTGLLFYTPGQAPSPLFPPANNFSVELTSPFAPTDSATATVIYYVTEADLQKGITITSTGNYDSTVTSEGTSTNLSTTTAVPVVLSPYVITPNPFSAIAVPNVTTVSRVNQNINYVVDITNYYDYPVNVSKIIYTIGSGSQVSQNINQTYGSGVGAPITLNQYSVSLSDINNSPSNDFILPASGTIYYSFNNTNYTASINFEPVTVDPLVLTASYNIKPSALNDKIIYTFVLKNIGSYPITMSSTGVQYSIGTQSGYIFQGATVPAATSSAPGSISATVNFTVSSSDISLNGILVTASGSGTETITPSLSAKRLRASSPSTTTIPVSLLSNINIIFEVNAELIVETVVSIYDADGNETQTGLAGDVLQYNFTISNNSIYPITISTINGYLTDNAVNSTTTPVSDIFEEPLTAKELAGTTIDINASISATDKISGTGIIETGGINHTTLTINPATGISLPYLLPAGQSFQAVADYTITQANADNGYIWSTVLASGTFTYLNVTQSVDSRPSIKEVDLNTISNFNNSNFTLVKNAYFSPVPDVVAPGDILHYNFSITNDTGVTLDYVGIVDKLSSPASPPLDIYLINNQIFTGGVVDHIPVSFDGTNNINMPPNKVLNGAAKYVITQNDIDNSYVNNTAYATAVLSNGTKVQTKPSSFPMNLNTVFSLSIVKSSNAPTTTPIEENDQITYSFVVTNNGTGTLYNISIKDVPIPPASPIPASSIGPIPSSLAPGASFTATAMYSVSANDVLNKGISDYATVTGYNVNGIQYTAQSNTLVIPISKIGALSLSETTSPVGLTNNLFPGDIVDYNFTITNIGNDTINNLVLNDQINSSTSDLPLVLTLDATTLAPGEITYGHAKYAVSQDDVNNGNIIDSSQISGIASNGAPVSATAGGYVTINSDNSITLSITSDPTNITKSGEKIKFMYNITNTGNQTLYNLSIFNEFISSNSNHLDIYIPVQTLNSGQSTVGIAHYVVTSGDITKGYIETKARVEGMSPVSTIVSSVEETLVLSTVISPAVKIVKSYSAPSVLVVDSKIDYSFKVSNTGKSILYNLMVTDLLTDPNQTPMIISPSVYPQLNPGDDFTFKASYKVQQIDFDKGYIENTATVDASLAYGPSIAAKSNTVKIPVKTIYELEVITSSVPTEYKKVGEKIMYEFKVLNKGNMPIYNIGVLNSLTSKSYVPLNISPNYFYLGPLVHKDCYAPYIITKDDIIRGSITSITRAVGYTTSMDLTLSSTPMPLPSQSVSSPASKYTIDVESIPNILLTINSDVSDVSYEGQIVKYTYTIKNTGTIALNDIALVSEINGIEGVIPMDLPLTLDPYQVYTSSPIPYSVTRDDIRSGSFINKSIAYGFYGVNGSVQNGAKLTINVDRTPSLVVSKTAYPSKLIGCDQVIKYTFDVKNAGNTSIDNIILSDTIPNLNSLMPAPFSLKPNEKYPSFSLTYPITTTDIVNTYVSNSFSAEGVLYNGAPVKSNVSTVKVDIDLTATISLSITSNVSQITNIDEPIKFYLTITNTGYTPLTNIAPVISVNPSFPFILPIIPSLAVNSSPYVITIDHIVNDEDILNGFIKMSGYVNAESPNKPIKSSQESLTLNVVPTASISLSVSGVYDKSKNTIAYSFLMTNTGNIPLSEIAISNYFVPTETPLIINFPSNSLPKGGDTITATATYKVTEANALAGKVETVSRAIASTPTVSDGILSSIETTIIDVSGNYSLLLNVMPDPLFFVSVGEMINYRFVIENTGNITIRGITISDSLLAPANPPLVIDLPETTLAPGQIVVGTASYKVTQMDYNNGQIVNNTTAVGFTRNFENVLVRSNRTSTTVSKVSLLYLMTFDSVQNINNNYISTISVQDTNDEVVAFTNTLNCYPPIFDLFLSRNLVDNTFSVYQLTSEAKTSDFFNVPYSTLPVSLIIGNLMKSGSDYEPIRPINIAYSMSGNPNDYKSIVLNHEMYTSLDLQTGVFSKPSPVSCIHKDSLISTNKGLVRISDLKTDKDIKLYDHNNKLVDLVYNIKLLPIRKYVKINKDAFAPNMPSEDLLIRVGHPILLDNKEILVEYLVNGGTINYYEDPNKDTAYAICTKDRIFVMTSNVPVCTWAEEEWLESSKNRNLIWKKQ